MENNENDFNEFEDNQSNQLSEKEIEEQETHEASAKTAHVVGKAAATYFGGAVGNKIYNVASKTKLGKSIESTAGKALEKSPVSMLSKPAMKTLNKSGVLDVADKAIDAAGSKDSIEKNPQDVSNLKNSNLDSISNQNIMDELPQNNDISNDSKEKKEEKNASFLINLLIKNPLGMLIIFGIFILFLILFYYVYAFVSDMDLVGTKMTSYSEAESISGYCNQIILIKEHDDFTGNAVSSIDDVDLSETFTLNRQTVNRWKTETYDVETYIKGVVEAEAIEVHDKKTFEVAAIAARTYALQIANSKCYIWNNKNKRTQYRNPQNFISNPSDSDVSSAVSETAGIVITLNNNLVDMNNGNYYDYFCNIGKDKETDEKYYYKMLQENEEERLLIPSDWAQENNAEGKEYSGKYDGQCQQEGMSLFGAKYLLNKPVDKYTTFRILKYYYGYDIEFKRVATAVINGNGCYWWPTTSTTITSFFGPRTAPIAGASTNHGALDIGTARNSEVYAVTGGTVTNVVTGCSEGNLGCGGGYGNYIIINHGNGIESLYAHLNSIKVSIGENVTQGQVVALSGSTGRSTGPHLHFEIRLNGTKVDPLNYINSDNTKPSCTFGGGNVVVGSTNEQTVCKTLATNGFTPAAISGIMTNLASESGFNPNAFNSSGGGQGAYGIAQWRGARQTSLKALANYNTLEVQLQYLISEITTGSEKAAGNDYMSAMNTGADANSMTYNWCYNYERPGTNNSEKMNACNNRVSANSERIQSYYIYAQNGCN